MGMLIALDKMGIKDISKQVDRAYNGLEALNKVMDALESETHIYGLVLTDLSMPVMDGFELAQGIRKFYREQHVPQPMIVACSGHSEQEFVQRAWASEIDEVITKPTSVENLKEIFKDLL